MAELDTLSLGRRAEAMIRELAGISAEEGRLTRLYLTPEHRRAADTVARWMAEVGLEAVEDGLGTVRGRLAAPEEGPAARRLLIGSHIDTVIDAGAYDGAFGVIAGILAAEHIAGQRIAIPFGLDVLAFGDEEGSRFPATLLCSNAVAGSFDPTVLDIESVDAVTLRDALLGYGKDPAAAARSFYGPGEAIAYLEAHIEQGPVLEAKREALGIVTAIAAQSRLSVTVAGEAGHAGTVPMTMRRDSLAAAAEMMALLESLALEHGSDHMVGTVGRIAVAPGASNVIAAKTSFTVDLRAQSDAVHQRVLATFRDGVQRIARQRGVTAWIESAHHVGATACDPAVSDRLAEAVRSLGGQAPRLTSGAGHDGQAMARLCPIAMLFVRCRGGISHNPAEHASVEDMGLAVATLIRFIETFDGRVGAIA